MFHFRLKRGIYGYRRRLKVKNALLIVLLAIFILVQLWAKRYFNAQFQMFLNVMAVLTALPIANLASQLVAIGGFPAISRETYDAYRIYEDRCIMLYDLVLSTKEHVIPADVIAIHPTGIYLWCTNPKANPQKAEQELNESLSNQSVKLKLHVSGDQRTFDKRMKSLKLTPAEGLSETLERANYLLCAMSM
ncbi:MAG: O-linked GlcNAc transferase-like protein [Otoolea sp.]